MTLSFASIRLVRYNKENIIFSACIDMICYSNEKARINYNLNDVLSKKSTVVFGGNISKCNVYAFLRETILTAAKY